MREKDIFDLMGFPSDMTDEELEVAEKLHEKLKEYSDHFHDGITTELLPMTDEEIIANIDKCLKNNRKWQGYIVPELDYDDVDI